MPEEDSENNTQGEVEGPDKNAAGSADIESNSREGEEKESEGEGDKKPDSELPEAGGDKKSGLSTATDVAKKVADGSLTTPESVLMLCMAGFFDLIGLIPLVGDISDIIAGIIFLIWTLTKPSGGKKVLKFLLAFILEAIPIVSDIAPLVSLVAMICGQKWPTSWIGYVYSII
jgi:hypothetical protein